MGVYYRGVLGCGSIGVFIKGFVCYMGIWYTDTVIWVSDIGVSVIGMFYGGVEIVVYIIVGVY